MDRNKLLEMVREYARKEYAPKEFVKGLSSVPVSGRVFDEDDVAALVDSALDFHLTTYRYNDEFEKGLKEFFGLKYALTCNSGSSANLIAVTSLTSHLLKDRALKAVDEVITVAAGFPTTVNPILQNNLVPVFVDVELKTYNVNVEELEKAKSDKTKAVILAHTLGNPFNIQKVREFCDKYNLWLIEDCCDALGSTYNNKKVGTFGDIATLSFYPAHHITMGEGGAVLTDNPILKKAMESIRDWGRDCWCSPGCDDTCRQRFSQKIGDLPEGYDHKYTYSHLGYNLKITDMQAACGVAQLRKINEFIEKRKENFKKIKNKLEKFSKYLILPKEQENSDPSWFGFLISVKEEAPFTRNDIVKYLNDNKIGTRLLFAGNIIKQPYMIGRNYRIVGELTNSDFIMNNTFWIGVYPGIDDSMIDYVELIIGEFISNLGGK
ncbi:lipopolysaccharide biosynthesis protein RfbH [Brachyspira murdochii]|uniref:DegT/DnrJ/EryC1/StrS aminotransferase n=1 Tax=Brachyspira murdochii (strain ATCC 51284 / DSM 12563 / 56-150) TaxID=526224 RepID=D5U4J1_BRAM5|nr:lipopolysaccharide biosynthesis protein RfbH [Brachyspira murdochii]ADG70236.1 DegT/DnrJ/EryC1/StrS aminotransferase [Brachyspira murdochii DSM 12563]